MVGDEPSQRVALAFAVLLTSLAVIAMANGTDLVHLFAALR